MNDTIEQISVSTDVLLAATQIRLAYVEGELSAAKERIAELENTEDALLRIEQWCDAYPLDIFPEPDLQRVREALALAGITIDAVTASNCRHVLMGIRRIIDAARKEIEKCQTK